MPRERATERPDSDGPAEVSPQVDQLIADLEQPGRRSDSGEFTLDRKVARRKIREIVSHAPHRSVLHLIQSAVLREASQLDIQLSDREILVSFDGAPFGLQCFQRLYDSVLSRFEEPEMAGVRELALGLAACLNLDSQSIRVRSGNGGGDSAMELQIGRDQEDVMGPCDADPHGTEILITFPFRSALSAKSLPLTETWTKELRVRAAYARLSIHCNRERIAPGPGLSTDAVGVVAVSDEGVTGAAGYAVKRRKKGKIRIVRNGVWVDTVSEPPPAQEAVELRLFDSVSFSPAPLSAVTSDRLGFDLSGEKVIRDRELKEVKQIVIDARATTPDTEELQLQLEERYRAQALGPLQDCLAAAFRKTLIVQPLAILAALVMFSALCGVAAGVGMLVIYVLTLIADWLATLGLAIVLMEVIFGLYLAWALSLQAHGAIVSRLIQKPMQQRFQNIFRDRVLHAAARSILVRDYVHYERRKWILKRA